MTEISNPIVQAVHDAIEAAVAATATELAQAVGFVGPATADQVRDRVEQLKNTIRQYLHWTSAAIPVLHAACAVRGDPAQLPALMAVVDQYQARPAQPEPRPPYILPAPSPWLNAIDEAIAALDSDDDRYGEEVAGLETLRAELTGEGAPEIDAVWPAWPDTNEPLWASLLAQVEAEPDLVTRGADEPGDVECEMVPEQSREIEVLIEIDAHGLLTCTPPTGVRVRVFDAACQDGAETMLFTSAGEVERQPSPSSANEDDDLYCTCGPLTPTHTEGQWRDCGEICDECGRPLSPAAEVEPPRAPWPVMLTDIDESGRQRAALIYLSEFIEIVIPRPGGVIPGRIDPEHELAVVRVELLDGAVRLLYWDHDTCPHGDGVIMSLVPACPPNALSPAGEQATPLTDYLCVFFADAPGRAPVAFFDRAAFAHDFVRANPGRFREEDPAQDWITYGTWRRHQRP